MMNTQAVVHIRKGEARSLKAGGMWIYAVSYTHLTLPTTPYV